VLALLALHGAFGLAPAVRSFRNDFLNYDLPARARAEGRPLDRAYERLWMAREAARAGQPFVGLFMPNPPPNALLLIPLARLSPPAAKAAWTLLLAAALAGAFVVMRRLLAAPWWWTALAFLAPFTAVANALGYGPPYALIVLLVALSLAALLAGREWASGLLLAPVVVLKLYALALLPYFLWTRRWRAAAGLVLGCALLVAVSVAVLGLPVHLTYLREMLPASLDGRIIDPYSPFWQTVPAVARRLFQLEPELNPSPLADRPALAVFLSSFATVAVLGASLLAARRGAPAERVRREWAALLLASLAVSPMTASYHLVLLAIPCAILLDGARGGPRAALVLGLLAFAGSSLPHAFNGLAHGWGNLVACPRLLALLALWALAAAPLLTARAAGTAVALALAAGAAAAALLPRTPAPGQWHAAARGVLLSEPVECGGRLRWIAPEPSRYVVAADDGGRSAGDTLRCVDGALAVGTEAVARALGVEAEAGLVDVDRARDTVVLADPARGELRERVGEKERVLARGRLARPRLSPDGRWVVFQVWEDGSWDVRAVERGRVRSVRVAGSDGDETEPSWSADGARVYFVSTWRRGLFGGAVRWAPFPPP
jgi:hypothetical protein